MEEREMNVKITKIDISFVNLVFLIVKIALASIPAMFILWFAFMIFGLLFGGSFSMFMHQYQSF